MLIKVKAITCAKEEKITKKKDDQFEVMVYEAPVRGEANKRIIDILGKYFNVPAGRVKIVKGFKESNKIFDIKQ
jgi:uncharacterized protein YggU (UPF0235/DUF167 family)